MLQAIIEATKAYKQNEVPVGAVIVKNNQIIARGYNNTTKDPTYHAEVVAIKNAVKYLGTNNLSDCKIYISLEPCMFCFGLINYVKIKYIYYDQISVENGVCGGWQDFSLLRPFGNKTICLQTNFYPQYSNLLKKFFQKRRNGRVVEGGGLENRFP